MWVLPGCLPAGLTWLGGETEAGWASGSWEGFGVADGDGTDGDGRSPG